MSKISCWATVTLPVIYGWVQGMNSYPNRMIFGKKNTKLLSPRVYGYAKSNFTLFSFS